MQKFSLFVESKKFYWSTNKIFYLSLFLCIGALYLKKNVLKMEEENMFDTIFKFLAIAIMLIGFINMFRGFTQIKPLRGKLDGYLVFDNNNVCIKDEIIPISEIRKIQISNNDYRGLLESTKGNFGPALSNGTKNYVVIYLENGKTKKYWFELINSNDFQNIRDILIEYHLLGKIDFWELAEVLGEKSSSEVKDFKEEILNKKHYR